MAFTYKDLQEALSELDRYLPEGYNIRANRENNGYRLYIEPVIGVNLYPSMMLFNSSASKAWEYFKPRIGGLLVYAWIHELHYAVEDNNQLYTYKDSTIAVRRDGQTYHLTCHTLHGKMTYEGQGIVEVAKYIVASLYGYNYVV